MSTGTETPAGPLTRTSWDAPTAAVSPPSSVAQSVTVPSSPGLTLTDTDASAMVLPLLL